MAYQFYNSINLIFRIIDPSFEVHWIYCTWHFLKALKSRVIELKFDSEIKNKIITMVYWMVYARTPEEFMESKNDVINFLVKNRNNKNTDIKASEKKKYTNLLDYMEMKIKTHQGWAYYLRVDSPIGTNISIERFHLTFKSSSPDGQSCTVDKLISLF